jgi:hypothetical protein
LSFTSLFEAKERGECGRTYAHGGTEDELERHRDCGPTAAGVFHAVDRAKVAHHHTEGVPG